MKKNKKLLLLLIGASALGSATTLMATTALRATAPQADTFIADSRTPDTDDGTAFVRTSTRPIDTGVDFTVGAERTINSVVSIKSFETPRSSRFQGGDDWDPFEFFFGPGFGNGQRRRQQTPQQSEPQAKGSGSGVIISDDGYIVTNNHVIDGAEKLEVTLNDNSKYNATVVGTDPNTDIALIKISAKGLTPVVFANSDDVKVGQWVLAVGNPFTFNSTVTAGIISAKARGLAESSSMGIKAFIQHDAAVNPGNSGGALVNTAGELVGINTMIYSNTGNYSGCSFAVPSNTVKKVVTDIKQYGTVQRAVLGIQYRELNADLAKENGITATNEGIYVGKVTDRGAAKEAGIEEGDVIVSLGGNSVKNSGEMQEQMNKLRPGDKAEVQYYRDNKLRKTTVTFKNNQGDTKMTKSSDMTSLGCAFMELSDADKRDLNISQGVKVAGLKAGKFKRAGVKDGFIVTEINNVPVNSSDDVENIYNQIMRSTDPHKVMLVIGLYPNGKNGYYAVDLSDVEED